MRPARLPRAARSERAGSQSLRAWSQESVYWGSRRKKEGKGGEIYHKKSVKSAEFLHEKGGISIWPQLPSEATEASNENEFKTQSDVFLDGVRGTEQQPPPRGSPPTPPSPAAPQPRWAPPRSVHSPQRGPPLPSRSSQSGGQTRRSVRSTQWRTSKQEAKSVLSKRRRGEFRGRGVEEAGGGGVGRGPVQRGCGRDVSHIPQTLGMGQTPRKGRRRWLLARGPDPASLQQLGTAVASPPGGQHTRPPGTETRVFVGKVRQPLRPKGSCVLLQGLLMAVSSTEPLGTSPSRTTNLPSVIMARGPALSVSPGPRS